MYRVLVASLLLVAGAAADGPCCTSCTDPAKKKYYSIDHTHNMCGECCMEPSKFHIYKIFEPGLTNATTAHPCHDHKYSNYSQTVTHGFGPIKMTLDLYKPDEGTVIEEEVGSGAFKDIDAKAVGCCGKKITGGEGAVSDCMVKLCSSAAYKPNYCGEDAATQKKIGDCTGAVSSCSLKKCALHCLAGSCNDACTSCVKSNCDTDVEACLNPLGWEAPRICDTSLPTC